MKDKVDYFSLHSQSFEVFIESHNYNEFSAKIYFLAVKLPKIKKLHLIGAKLDVKHYLYSLLLSLDEIVSKEGDILKTSEQLIDCNHNIALFADYPNIDISIRESGIPQYPNFSLIKHFITFFGKINHFNVYGDWNMMVDQKKYLKTIAYAKLINVSHLKFGNGKKKDTVDMKIALDIGSMLEAHPEINMYVLITGDADFLPVANEIIMRGKKVIIIAEKNSLSGYLKKNFRNIITYQEIIGIFNSKDKTLSQDLPGVAV